MAQWKKVIVSGSAAELLNVTASAGISAATIKDVTTFTAGGDLDIGAHEFRAATFESDISTGTAPFTVASTTEVANLKAATAGTAATVTSATQTSITTTANLVTVGALDAGSITSGFTSIDVGSGFVSGSNIKGITGSFDHLRLGYGNFTSASLAAAVAGAAGGDMTGVSLTGGNGISVIDEANTTAGSYSATLNVNSGSMLPYYSSSIFSKVSGDVSVTAAGVATVTGATTNAALTAGDGLNNGGGTFTGGTARTFSVDSGSMLPYYSSSIFSTVSGDVAITATGAATIQANSVALGTDTTGAYVASLTAGALIDLQNNTGETASPTIDVDLTEAAEGAIADGDYILFLDGGATGTHAKEALADVATYFAGDGLQAASSVMAVDVSDFAGTGLEDDGSDDLRLATQGTGISGGNGSTLSITPAQTAITSIYNTALQVGTADDQEYITFGSSNEVNTFVNNGEILSVTANGIDVTGTGTFSGAVTIEGNLTVNGTTTTISSTNTEVKDQFLFLNSGSTDQDGGIIVRNHTNNSGSAFFFDNSADRWAFSTTGSVAKNSSTAAAGAYVSSVVTNDTNPEYEKNGNIKVASGDVWIYVE